MRLSSKQRNQMLGKRFVSDVNHSADMSVTVHDVRATGGGHTVVYTQAQSYELFYLGLGAFIKRYPDELES